MGTVCIFHHMDAQSASGCLPDCQRPANNRQLPGKKVMALSVYPWIHGLTRHPSFGPQLIILDSCPICRPAMQPCARGAELVLFSRQSPCPVAHLAAS
ncbi:hypothetical protein IF1G_07863 [Cordyceps javanica]|uniref:Uncharacterized protein n=1 Tax=Cordyceps javanica TaxID=43265 RepID=A0A545UV02_9HYPO|nr:hypothetical protein IF1G_07863 [Cordyceps javanica]